MADGSLKITTPSACEIRTTREFQAPRSWLFRAWTDPEWIPRWMGPLDGSLTVQRLDLQVGGGYRFTWPGADGAETGEQGVYREIVPPERISWTNTFDHWFAGEALVTTTFVERNGDTTVTTTVRFPSMEVRDSVLQSDVGTALSRCYRRLDALLRLPE